MVKIYLKAIILWMFVIAGVMAQEATEQNIAEIYIATFDRAPDADGLKYWVNSGLTIEEIAESFFAQPETKKKYPDTLPNTLFVRTIYSNLFNRSADDDGVAYWTERLEDGSISRGNMILAIAQGARNSGYGPDKTILDNKTEVGLYYAQQGLNDPVFAKRSLQGVGASSSSTKRAMQQIDGWVNPYPVEPAKPFVKLQNCQEASVVIGQPDMTSVAWGGTLDEKSFSGGMYSNPLVINGHLYLGDYFFSRVMGYDTIPQQNGVSADFVLGQNDFYSNATGNGANELNWNCTSASTQGKFFIADLENNRVLGYNSIPLQTDAPADFVIGQNAFGSSSGGTSSTEMASPTSIFAVNGKIIVADGGNNRILIYNHVPIANGAAADIVLGQADMNSGVQNRGGAAAANTLNFPVGVWSDGKRLAVLDSDNNRVLIWNTFPTSNGQPADVVLGQSDFSHTAPNDDDQDNAPDAKPSARTLSFYSYHGINSNGIQLFVTDGMNNRVLIWNRFPTKNFTPADRVLGQCAFDTMDVNGPSGTVSAKGLNYPNGVFAYGKQLIVVDQANGRILIYK